MTDTPRIVEWINGEQVTRDMTAEEIAALPPPPPITSDDVNMERDRRMNGGFVFQGVKFQSEAESKARILGAAQLAFMALAGGASPTSLRWHGGASDFSWIAEDNSIITMTAPTVIAFGQAAAQWETAHLFHARAVKAMNPIPANYADDAYWPVLWPAA